MIRPIVDLQKGLSSGTIYRDYLMGSSNETVLFIFNASNSFYTLIFISLYAFGKEKRKHKHNILKSDQQ